jgi:hypothetical protein
MHSRSRPSTSCCRPYLVAPIDADLAHARCSSQVGQRPAKVVICAPSRSSGGDLDARRFRSVDPVAELGRACAHRPADPITLRSGRTADRDGRRRAAITLPSSRPSAEG